MRGRRCRLTAGGPPSEFSRITGAFQTQNRRPHFLQLGPMPLNFLLPDSLRRVLPVFFPRPQPIAETPDFVDSEMAHNRAIIDALPVGHTPWQSEAQGKFNPLRRSIIALLPRQPFVDWLRAQPGEKDANLRRSHEHNSISFLVPYPMNTHEAVRVIPEHWPRFFAQMLERVRQNPHDWPEDRTWEMFQQWFEIEYRDVVLDISDAISSLDAVQADAT